MINCIKKVWGNIILLENDEESVINSKTQQMTKIMTVTNVAKHAYNEFNECYDATSEINIEWIKLLECDIGIDELKFISEMYIW